jgi:hypothetical protein
MLSIIICFLITNFRKSTFLNIYFLHTLKDKQTNSSNINKKNYLTFCCFSYQACDQSFLQSFIFFPNMETKACAKLSVQIQTIFFAPIPLWNSNFSYFCKTLFFLLRCSKFSRMVIAGFFVWLQLAKMLFLFFG